MHIDNISQSQIQPTMRSNLLKMNVKGLSKYAGKQTSIVVRQKLIKLTDWLKTFDDISDIAFLAIPRVLLCALLVFTGYVFYDFSRMQKNKGEKHEQQNTEITQTNTTNTDSIILK